MSNNDSKPPPDPAQRRPHPSRARLVVGPIKFVGNPWVVVSIIALGVVALTVLTIWASPDDIVAIITAF